MRSKFVLKAHVKNNLFKNAFNFSNNFESTPCEAKAPNVFDLFILLLFLIVSLLVTLIMF